MSRLIATPSVTNFTDANWGVCDTTSAWVIDSEAGTLVITTSTTTHTSPNSTPGAITVDGVLLKISSRVASPTGTFTVALRNTSAGSDVTTVVVNVTDMPINGWCFFKFSGSQLLLAATTYAIRVTCSVGNEVTLFRSTASAQEFSRLIRTTTTAAPGAGDQLIIGDELTGAGTKNDVVVTMNNTASTVFGSTTYTESVEICNGASLTWGTAASTNYLLTVAGNVHIHDGGTWNQGTSVTRIPSTSTARLVFSVAVNVDSGFIANPGSIVNRYGNIVTSDSTLLTISRGGYCTTSGTSVTAVTGQSFTGLTGTITISGVNYTISSVTDSTHLTLTGSAGTQSSPVIFTHAGTANVLTVASTSGWAVGNMIAIAPTSRTSADCESAEILTVDSSTQVTLTAALTKQHSGDSPTQAEVINLTRNVRVEGTSSSLQGYVTYGNLSAPLVTGTINDSYCEFKYLGSANSGKRGVDIIVTTASLTMIGCTFHDFVVDSSLGINSNGFTNNNISITYSHFYNIYGNHIYIGSTSGTNITLNNCIAIKNMSGIIINISEISSNTFTNLTAIGAQQYGFYFNQSGIIGATISNWTSHSNENAGIYISQITSGTFNSLTSWRNNGYGLQSGGSYTINGLIIFGNQSFNIFIDGSTTSNLILENVVSSGDIVFSTSWGIYMAGAPVYIYNSTFGVASGIKTAHSDGGDLVISSKPSLIAYLYNCLLASTREIAQQESMAVGSVITSHNHDQTGGLYKRWEVTGTATIDTIIYRTASPAEKLTPMLTTLKFKSTETNPIAIDNGQTAIVTVYVYKSASYNGAQPRLILKRNNSIGITSDTVLATAVGGTGSWLALSGTTPAATADGAFVCCVDCDGDAGTVNVDDWSVA